MNLYVINESTKLDDFTAWRYAWCVDYQLQFHFARSGWLENVRCGFLKKGQAIPAGASLLHLVDRLSVPGALGFHDEDGNEVPFSQVGVQTTLEDGGQVSEVMSHEALELAADPHVNLSALATAENKLYALEVGDPVQGTAYDVFEPEGKTGGVVVANFALPAYFDPNTKAERVDFRGVLSGPFTIAPKGYMSYLDLTNVGAGWQQHRGSEVEQPVIDSDDRSRQRHLTLAAATRPPFAAEPVFASQRVTSEAEPA